MLLAAAGVVFVIACSNVANLILARSVRREGELAVRAALGASRGALRRTLLAESLVLCGAGARARRAAGAAARAAVVARFAARFSVRALDVTVDASLLWVGAGLAMAAAVLLAYVPQPAVAASRRPGSRLASGGVRIDARHQPPAARVRHGADRVFVRAARRRRHAAGGARRPADGAAPALDLRAGAGARRAAADRVVRAEGDRRSTAGDAGASPSCRASSAWRSATSCPGATSARFGRRMPFAAEGYTPADGEEDPRARLRIVSPGFFAALGVPLLAGRDFTDDDRRGSELVVIVSQSVAQRLFPNGDALNRQIWWTDPILRQAGAAPHRRRGGGRGRRERRAGGRR